MTQTMITLDPVACEIMREDAILRITTTHFSRRAITIGGMINIGAGKTTLVPAVDITACKHIYNFTGQNV